METILIASAVFIVLIYFFAPILDFYVYTSIDNFSFILLLTSINVPIAILTGVIVALYRSVFKIKEIILYGTFIIVPIRAILTYFTYIHTDNIMYFIVIELFTSFLSFVVLFYLFNRDVFPLFFTKKDPNPLVWKISNPVLQIKQEIFTSLTLIFPFFSVKNRHISPENEKK